MKLSLLACLFGSASAFTAPASSYGARSATKLSAEKSVALPFLPAPENLKGYVGDVGFDPLRFSDFVPMDYLREAELKHGRICMMAWLGFVTVDMGFRIYPLPEAYEGLTSVTAHDALVTNGAMGQLLLFIGLAEMIGWIAIAQMLQGSGREPGDYGLDPLQLIAGKSEAEVNEMKLRELKNGRLAMLAFSGVVTQAVLTGGPFPYV
uniref:Plastid light harvesting protein n=1 Tax=Corethron hystrix TaxID=216773 RepID=A0A7S1FM28_9STRA|mmetsp:Transcript_12978/g.28646  ORF Transcript_12978/g.28646 Transcript_12978/m.28646 type:complete len:207 (+) Transcript_12978:96-716(+)|eukprot:CAMPEP_0113312732 /NCGR_PEP_ID=MMETSP0010_2-20120614/9448_1 /TAXON_ID=216773 ORGANISM="Corethron hystrix, Strain 308" /NCGR_SAMPLE_ID=MMETSP0010_2 /ASSEMBLY_ACC=CAM_ASM_000155 /LENGTH=206 /DNA_ID=CAMNT_0000168623 /DNA_START=92 /DNA_END=712 /DNA_ORIENTATION=- /assembly_acc=CAM_ASM_000155